MTPGALLRDARERRQMSIEDVALMVGTDPHICAHDRAEWLALVEADRAAVTIDVGLVLCELLGCDWDRLVLLVALAAAQRVQAATLSVAG